MLFAVVVAALDCLSSGLLLWIPVIFATPCVGSSQLTLCLSFLYFSCVLPVGCCARYGVSAQSGGTHNAPRPQLNERPRRRGTLSVPLLSLLLCVFSLAVLYLVLWHLSELGVVLVTTLLSDIYFCV